MSSQSVGEDPGSSSEQDEWFITSGSTIKIYPFAKTSFFVKLVSGEAGIYWNGVTSMSQKNEVENYFKTTKGKVTLKQMLREFLKSSSSQFEAKKG